MTTTHESATTGARTSSTSWLPLIVLLSGTFLVGLDFFIVNVALPSVQSDLHAGSAALEWLVAGYGLTYGSLLLAASAVGERWGLRSTYVTGIVVFVVASAACGFAPNVTALVAARLLQGAGAALLSPMVLALLNVVYDGADRLRALGIYSTFLGLAGVSGQLIGGLLIRADIAGLGWRAIFLVNVPVGVAAALAAPRVLPRGERREAGQTDLRKLDLAGLGLVVTATTAILLPLLEGRRLGWPAWTWGSLAAGLVVSALLVRRSHALTGSGRAPLIDPEALRSPAVRRGLLGHALLFLGMASYFLVLAVYLQQGRGLSPLNSGLVFTIMAATYLIGTQYADAVRARLGRATIPGSALLFAVGHVITLLAVESHGSSGSVLWLAPGLLLSGLGVGVCLSSLITAVMGGVEPRHAAAVSGVLAATQQLSNSLGVAVIGLFFFGPADLDHAFARSLVVLAVLMGALAALAMPRTAARRQAVRSEL